MYERCGGDDSELHTADLLLHYTVNSSRWTGTGHSQLRKAGSTYTSESHPQIRTKFHWNPMVEWLCWKAARPTAQRCRGVGVKWSNFVAPIIGSSSSPILRLHFSSNSVGWDSVCINTSYHKLKRSNPQQGRKRIHEQPQQPQPQRSERTKRQKTTHCQEETQVWIAKQRNYYSYIARSNIVSSFWVFELGLTKHP